MNYFDFIKLFRAILSPDARVDVRKIEDMGLLAVKIAQMYSVRADLVSAEKCVQLSGLLQRTAPLTPEELQHRWDQLAPAALREELGELPLPALAAASLGQIHRGTLRDGRRVAVKISRREFRDEFVRDVHKLRRMLRTSLFFYRKLERLADPLNALETVERQTLTEMNFLNEIAGAERLALLASERSDGLKHLQQLHFPKYYPEHSHERLLVSEFVEGHTLAEWLERGVLPYDALLELFHIHGYFLFVRGEFHGDLHPGNVIWQDGHFWFLDNANIETIPPRFARGLFNILVLIGEGDIHRAALQLAGLSLAPLPAARLGQFQSDFVALYRGFAGRTVKEMSLTRQMIQTVKLAVACGIQFPRGAFPLIKSLMYLDGMVLRAAPNARLLRDVARFANDFLPLKPGAASSKPALSAAYSELQHHDFTPNPLNHKP